LGNIRKFTGDTLVYGLGNGLKKFIGIFLLPFYTRALSPADYGIMASLATLTYFISAIIGVGIDSASGFYFFEAKTEKEKGQVLFTTFILRLLTAVPSFILSFFSKSISEALFGTSEYTWLVFISCITIPVSFLLSEQSHLYRFYRQPWKYNLVVLLKSLTAIGFGITLVVVLKYGVYGALLSTLASSSIVVVFSFFYYSRKKYFYLFSWHYAKKMLAFGYPLIWAAVGQWIYVSSDRLFLLHYRDLTEIGYYSIGATFSQPIGLLSMAVQMSFVVLFLELYNNEAKSRMESKKFASDVLRYYVTLSVIISVSLSVFSIIIIDFVTTPAYIMGSLAIPLLTFPLIFSQAQLIVAIGIYVNKKTWHYGWLVSIAALLNISLNFIFIPRWGFVGAGFTTVISYFAYFIGSYFVSQRYYKVNYRLISILFYILIAFAIALFVPFAELKFNIKITLLQKLSILMITLFLPFIFGILKIDNIKSIVANIRNPK